jgi:hypothetical protein
MAGKGRAVATIVKWGVKYGPHIAVVAQQAKDPAMAAAQKRIARVQAKRQAVEHASTVVDGSVLKAFDPKGVAREPVWVVFTGNEPIASYPATTTPLAELAAVSDLGKRIRPEDMPTPAERIRSATAKARRRPR